MKGEEVAAGPGGGTAAEEDGEAYHNARRRDRQGATIDPVGAFEAAMASYGITTKTKLQGDGRRHRFDVDGDPKGSRNGWYILHLDNRPAGAFGCWKRGVNETWKANGGPGLSDMELAQLRAEIERERVRREKQLAKEHQEAAELARRLWSGYRLAFADEHPYLVRKGVAAHGTRVDPDGNLVLPLLDVATGDIWSLETISPEGTKRFLPGGKKQGLCFPIGEPGPVVVIAEGFATAASIHAATGIQTIVAFDAGNLEPVARAIRAARPGVLMVIAADNDCETLQPVENPGVHFGRRAAAAARAGLAVPSWPEDHEKAGKKGDWNDIALALGDDPVADAIFDAIPPEIEIKGPGPEAARDSSSDPDAQTQAACGRNDAAEWQRVLKAAVTELNRSHFVVAVGGGVRIANEVYDNEFKRRRLVFFRAPDIALLYGNCRLKVGETRQGVDIVKGLGEVWLSHADRRTYRQMALITEGICPSDTYNLWRGFAVSPKPGPCPIIEAHLHGVICSGNDDLYQWLLKWMARCVQHPGKPAEVAVVFRGLKGTGKGMVGQIMMGIFRGHELHITQSKHLVGSFNSHLVDALFLFLDEAVWGGDKQGEAVLKALITEPTLMIEPKGVDAFPMPNRLKIVMSSNNDWVVPVSSDERRYFVLDVSEIRKGDYAYFEKLKTAIEGEELPAFLDKLLNLDLTHFNHRNPPHTAGLNQQKLIGADSLQKFWMDCLTAGTIVNMGMDDWPTSVPRDELHEAYVEHAHMHGDRRPLTSEQFGARLRQLCPDGTLKVIRPRLDTANNGRPRCFVLKTLEEHRRAFLEAMNISTYVWPQEEVGS